jgi:hypothetical protein
MFRCEIFGHAQDHCFLRLAERSAEYVNRGFIEKALVEAAKRLNANTALGLDIKIDQDTQGLGGTPVS